MAKIWKRSDRIPVKIDDITVYLAPLTFDQKNEVAELMVKGRANADVSLLTNSMCIAIMCSVVGIDGAEDAEGKPYQLSFEGDRLSKSCLDDLMNLSVNRKLMKVCTNLLSGIPDQFTDDEGKPIEGVEVLASKVEPEKKT